LGRAELSYIDFALGGEMYRPIIAANFPPPLLYLKIVTEMFAEMLDKLNMLHGIFPKAQIIVAH
jgi:hypothetical protein